MRLKKDPQTELFTLDTQIISIYGDMMLAKTSHDMNVLDQMLELCMDAREKEIRSLEIAAEFHNKLMMAAAEYVDFLRTAKNMTEDAALLYVQELLDLRDSFDLHEKATENNVGAYDGKTDYPYPPSKGDYVPPPRKENSSGDPEVLRSCELTVGIERARFMQRKQAEDRKKRPISFADIKALDENINSQINSLYGNMLFVKSSYEMDIIKSSIENIVQKKMAASVGLSKLFKATQSD